MSTQACCLLGVIVICVTVIICSLIDRFSDITDYIELKINKSKYEEYKKVIDTIKLYSNSNMSYIEIINNIRKLIDTL